jgi:hypothetical protein
MKEGCYAFISSWSEELENALINRTDDEAPIQKLCYEVTEACKNIDPKDGKKSDNFITVDGEPQPIVNLF